jgi:hypothetical protein
VMPRIVEAERNSPLEGEQQVPSTGTPASTDQLAFGFGPHMCRRYALVGWK